MNLDDTPRVIITHEFAEDLGGWASILLRLSAKRDEADAIRDEADAYLRKHPRVQAFLQGMDERDIKQILDAGFAVT